MSLAIILSVGAAVTWAFVAELGRALVESAFFSTDLPTIRPRILSDGTVVVEESRGRDNSAVFRTFSGKPLDYKRLEFDDNWSYLAGPSGWRSPPRALTWTRRIERVGGEGVNWFFVHDGAPHGHVYLVGYDRVTKLKTGYIGRGGFRPDEPPPEDCFPVDTHRWVMGGVISAVYGPDAPSRAYLTSDDGLVRIDLAKGSVVTVSKGDDLTAAWPGWGMADLRRPIGGGWSSVVPWPDGAILVRMPERILVLDDGGKQLAAYPLPAELRYGYLRCHRLPDSKVLLCQSQWFANENDLFWIDPDGRIVRHERVAPAKQPLSGVVRESVYEAITTPSPGILAGDIALDPRSDDPLRPPEYLIAVRDTLARRWPALAMSTTVSLVLAVLCFRRQRNHGLGGTWFWALFVLLFGVPAFSATWRIAHGPPGCRAQAAASVSRAIVRPVSPAAASFPPRHRRELKSSRDRREGVRPGLRISGRDVRRHKTISYRFPSVGNALCGVPRHGAVHFRGSRNATEGVPYRHAFIVDSVVYCFTAP